MRHISIVKYLFLLVGVVQAQTPFIEKVSDLKQNSWVKDISFERILLPEKRYNVTDIAVSSDDSKIIISVKDAGVWLSVDKGHTFRNIFENQITQNVTALSVNWHTNRIWVATDKGIFYSDSQGEQWVYAGLFQAKNISAMVCLPEDNNYLCVGVLGDDKPSEWRGVFKTSNAGGAWKKVLFINERTGVSQLQISDDNTLYAVTWEKTQMPYFSDAVGSGSGIYKSTDNATTWQHITSAESSFATGKRIGRIFLTESSKKVLYALVDNRTFFPVSKKNVLEPRYHTVPTLSDIRHMSASDFYQMSDDRLNAFIHTQDLQNRYTPKTLKDEVYRLGGSTEKLLSLLKIIPDSIAGAQLYKSYDRGKSWQKTETSIDNLFYKSGHQLGAILSLNDSLYVGGIPLLVSADEGENWDVLRAEGFSSGISHIWKSSTGRKLFISDNKGLLCSSDGGKTWTPLSLPINKNNGVAFAQNSLYIWSDDYIYRKSEDNALSQRLNVGGKNVAPTSNGKIFITGKYGGLSYIDFQLNTVVPIKKTALSSNLMRFNQAPPVAVVPQQQDMVYWGSHHLHVLATKSTEERILPTDLTAGDKNGNQAFATLTSISVSPLELGLMYTASDDGVVYRSDFMGESPQQIYKSLSEQKGFVKASIHNVSRVFAALYNSQTPVILISDNKGKDWKRIDANLPQTGVHFISEDKRSAELLYAGTDSGLFISFDSGERWHLFSNGLLQMPVTDIAFNESGDKIWVNTSMGVFSADISYINKLKAFVQNQLFYPLSEVATVCFSDTWGNSWTRWRKEETPKVWFSLFASKDVNLKVRILKDGLVLNVFEYSLKKGFNRVEYDLSQQDEMRLAHQKKTQKIVGIKSTNGNYYLQKGTYEVEFSAEDIVKKQLLEVK